MIIWSKSACADLRKAEISFMQQGNKELGKKIASHIQQATQQLARFPLGGKKGRVGGTRELAMPQLPYLIVYIPGKKQKIEVVRIISTDKLHP